MQDALVVERIRRKFQAMAPVLDERARRLLMGAAARQLGIHINSMTYRVERIQTLTGLKLDDPETRVAISIALRARAMLGM